VVWTRFGHVEHKNVTGWVEQCMSKEIEGTRQMGCPGKTWLDCVKVDMESVGLTSEDAQDRDQRRLRIRRETG